MSYLCPKCNEIMYPNADGICPLCGAQTKDEILLSMEEAPQIYENINKKLWDPTGFIWISVFFSFLPAAIVYAINCGRLGLNKKKKAALIAAPLVFIAVIVVSLFVETDSMRYIGYGLNIGIGLYMRNDQKELYKNHILSGGKKASYVLPVIGGMSFAAVIVGLVIWSTITTDYSLMVFAGDELYYTDNVSRDEVTKTGNYLVSIGEFTEDGKKISFKLDKDSDKYIVSIAVIEDYVNTPQVEQWAQEISKGLSANVFSGSKVEIDLCDSDLKVLKVIMPS